MSEITVVLKSQSGLANEMAQCVDRISATSNEGNARLLDAAAKLKASNDWLMERAKQLVHPDSPQSMREILKIDHLLLARRVTDVLLGTSASREAELLDAADCRLRHWLDSDAPAEFRGSPLFAQLETLPDQVYAQAKNVLRLHEAKDDRAAFQALSELIDVTNRFCLCVDAIFNIDDHADT